MNPIRFYRFMLAILLVGGTWMGISYLVPENWTPCFFHQLTGWPCPSCGSTRAFHALLQGEITDSVQINPLGVLAAIAAMLMVPFLLIDLLYGKSMVYRVYQHGEKWLKRPLIAVPFSVLVLANWIWNISKGL